MIKGTGELISDKDEEGNPLPFLTTEQILEQIAKFGFIVFYDLKSNLPDQVIAYLSELYNLGYDKITRILVQERDNSAERVWRPKIIVMKTAEGNDDLLTFDCQISYAKFADKLAKNSIMNVTDEPDMVWDWVNHMYNLSDVLDENIDPTDDYETKTDIETGHMTPYSGETPEGYTVYTGPDDDSEEESDD